MTKIMKRFLFIVLSAPLFICACEKDNKDKMPSFVQQVELSDIDMSAEREDVYYTYFRFVNETGVPILVEYLENGFDVVTAHFISPYFDAVDKKSSSSGFVHFGDYYANIHIYYNRGEDGVDNDYIKVSCTEGGVLDNSLWVEEIVDNNSVIRTFVFTRQMYSSLTSDE